jgi:hypothetical protein
MKVQRRDIHGLLLTVEKGINYEAQFVKLSTYTFGIQKTSLKGKEVQEYRKITVVSENRNTGRKVCTIERRKYGRAAERG